MANITSAIKTVKSAKFATGGDVVGAGTGTSDSIPAMLSNGESVMTANATSMFAPLLSTFNQMGGGVPIYGQQAGSQAMGEDMLARAFAKGVANLSPVVSVEEITRVTNRVKVLENLGVGYEGN
jgi:D-arabinose 1-dehydrogenase-like Zn-dependent alcohol dehydrogenase